MEMSHLGDAVGFRILVYDQNTQVQDRLSSLARQRDLTVVFPPEFDMLAFLARPQELYTDAVALFLTEEEDEYGLTGVDIAKKLQDSRKALPVFLRRSTNESATIDSNSALFAKTYSLMEIWLLESVLDHHLLAVPYPAELLHLFQDCGQEVIKMLLAKGFPSVKVMAQPAFVAKELLVSNSVLAFVPLNIACGKGYVLMQMSETTAIFLAEHALDGINEDDLMSEGANVMSGRLRSLLPRTTKPCGVEIDLALPVVMNSVRRDLCFGRTRPQLCLRYQLSIQNRVQTPHYIDIKLIFNAAWSNVDMDAVVRPLHHGVIEIL